jgi:hypothetical protein
MCQKMVQPLIVAAFVGLVISSGAVAAELVLLNGKPDPAYNNHAMQVWLRADVGVTSRKVGFRFGRTSRNMAIMRNKPMRMINLAMYRVHAVAEM